MDYDPRDKTILSNHFNPHNRTHVKAWAELRRTGIWPKWFSNGLVGKGIRIDPWWERMIRSRMADAWVKHVMTEPESEEYDE